MNGRYSNTSILPSSISPWSICRQSLLIAILFSYSIEFFRQIFCNRIRRYRRSCPQSFEQRWLGAQGRAGEGISCPVPPRRTCYYFPKSPRNRNKISVRISYTIVEGERKYIPTQAETRSCPNSALLFFSFLFHSTQLEFANHGLPWTPQMARSCACCRCSQPMFSSPFSTGL